MGPLWALIATTAGSHSLQNVSICTTIFATKHHSPAGAV